MAHHFMELGLQPECQIFGEDVAAAGGMVYNEKKGGDGNDGYFVKCTLATV